MSLLIISIAIMIAGSAFCSSSEAALFSTSENKVKALIEQDHPTAQNLLKIKENMSGSIGAIVILNNIFNIIGTLIIGILAAQVLTNEFELAIFSGILTFLIILLGEILPKNFGERFSTEYALTIAPVIQALSIVLAPVLWLLDLITKILFGKRLDDSVSEEEIKVMIDQGVESRAIEYDERKLIDNVFTMNDKSARDIMTPRINIHALDANLTLEEQSKTIYDSNHSRLPVYDDDYDTITGYVLLREVLQNLSQGNGHKTPESFSIELLKIQETTRVDSLLIIFQKKRAHMALVIDEFGGTSGIVTLEDVLEEIVGEIVDETDEVIDMREVAVNS
jgi:CBS domain containing-hemolysin-like protein